MRVPTEFCWAVVIVVGGCQALPLDDALRAYPDAEMIVEWGTDGEYGSCTSHGGLVE